MRVDWVVVSGSWLIIDELPCRSVVQNPLELLQTIGICVESLIVCKCCWDSQNDFLTNLIGNTNRVHKGLEHKSVVFDVTWLFVEIHLTVCLVSLEHNHSHDIAFSIMN